MMKYDNEQLVDKSPCAGVRADLKMCLLQSDCCKIVRNKNSKNKILFFIFQGKENSSRVLAQNRRFSSTRVSSL